MFASYESVIKSFVRGKERSAYLGHEGSVHTLLPFGEHLVSVDDKNNLKIWHIGNKGVFRLMAVKEYFYPNLISACSRLHPLVPCNCFFYTGEEPGSDPVICH